MHHISHVCMCAQAKSSPKMLRSLLSPLQDSHPRKYTQLQKIILKNKPPKKDKKKKKKPSNRQGKTGGVGNSSGGAAEGYQDDASGYPSPSPSPTGHGGWFDEQKDRKSALVLTSLCPSDDKHYRLKRELKMVRTNTASNRELFSWQELEQLKKTPVLMSPRRC